MNQRPPYSMAQLASEIVALDSTADIEYQRPDGLGVYLEAKVTADDHDPMRSALKRVREFDTRLTEVRDEDGAIVIRITPIGARWTRDPFHLDAMWEAATPARKATAKKATKKCVKKS